MILVSVSPPIARSVTTATASCVVPEDSPCSLSLAVAWEYWQDCYLLIGIGSRLELPYMRWRWFPKALGVVRIDIDPTEMVQVPRVGETSPWRFLHPPAPVRSG